MSRLILRAKPRDNLSMIGLRHGMAIGFTKRPAFNHTIHHPFAILMIIDGHGETFSNTFLG